MSVSTQPLVRAAVRVERGRRVWEIAWPPLTLVGAYALHWFIVMVFALAVTYGPGSLDCSWGGSVTSGPNSGFCLTSWGLWSPLLYLPELLLIVTVGGVMLTRKRSTLRLGALVTLAAVSVPTAILLVSHGWAVNQMPMRLWPLWQL
jgi:hypothetical protein